MVLPVELLHSIDDATRHRRRNWNARQWFATQMLNHIVNCLCVSFCCVGLGWLIAFIVQWFACYPPVVAVKTIVKLSPKKADDWC
jgi:hypothetical protein